MSYTRNNELFLAQSPWNPSGTNILNENWPFPIFMVDNEATINFLRESCFEKFNKPDPVSGAARDWPLCAIELLVNLLSSSDLCHVEFLVS